jgi:hypothetical protein
MLTRSHPAPARTASGINLFLGLRLLVSYQAAGAAAASWNSVSSNYSSLQHSLYASQYQPLLDQCTVSFMASDLAFEVRICFKRLRHCGPSASRFIDRRSRGKRRRSDVNRRSLFAGRTCPRGRHWNWQREY